MHPEFMLLVVITVVVVTVALQLALRDQRRMRSQGRTADRVIAGIYGRGLSRTGAAYVPHQTVRRVRASTTSGRR